MPDASFESFSGALLDLDHHFATRLCDGAAAESGMSFG